ncbi:MAG: metalloregulator ArsR/SmtB family transcription factor [Acidobacteriota bacterium]|nr:winged helix-turn-helix transcriptional regulator [Acidobacteriota bacterium]
MNPSKEKIPLSDEALEMVAGRFRCLGEPIRLKIIRALEPGEANVGQLVEMLHATQANVSKHLKVLVDAGILARRPQGTAAFYHIADPLVMQLCQIVCDALAEKLRSQAEVLGLTVTAENEGEQSR